MKRLIRDLMFEGGHLSLTRVLIVAALFLFVVGSAYDVVLTFRGKSWANYPTFASITGGAALGGKLMDKIVTTVKGSGVDKS